MSDIKLFRIASNRVDELEAQSVSIEKSLQSLIEKHLDDFLGVTFLATEYSTGKTHAGRIDTLGIDENGCPVIIEYKRTLNENVINQGLFYLDWLLDHKAEFELLVLKKLGQEHADAIEWPTPRLLCIAGDFTKYDEHAVAQINRNIELIRYRRYGDELMLFELVNAVTADSDLNEVGEPKPYNKNSKPVKYKGVQEYLADADESLTDTYELLKAFCLSLGDDVQLKTLKFYVAFKRIKNFACVEVHAAHKRLTVFVKVDPDTVALVDGFTRDVRGIGHYGTGDLEITIRSPEDLERAKELIVRSYEVS
ncbi:MAG: DUF91 domain-containing protein [Phycisphaerae bacterium]|nr:DUF91 domain-containing protein [Phycisphaerae bacterium]